MSILLTPTWPHAMPSLPPQIYLKHVPFISPISNSPHNESLSLEALITENEELRCKNELLQAQYNALHQRMQDSFDFCNTQMLFLAERGEAARQAMGDEWEAQKAAREAKDTDSKEVEGWKAVRNAAWEAAKVDNETALIQWEFVRATLPLKPQTEIGKRLINHTLSQWES
ncbi:hypothetical protein BS47DRAFT_1358779 [Hydnum rufescens UP504]|uniref:Uncharacterized protein n=1 Tax=Hydnum rufescens UP504 TaxID=1448309 RepID=A0A9P6B725_9AGAM|nr:hypothetical protein BS47DRAFT_1358779 [Hydnum rufescens UP504]